MAAKKINRAGPARRLREVQELGQVGAGRRDRHAELHQRRGHRRGGATGEEGQGDLARVQLRSHRPAGRQEQVPHDGAHQSDPHHAAHRHRRLFGRARCARHPRRRRHGGDAAAMRHAMGRARPRLLRGPHVERLRLPHRDQRRRAEMRHREDQEQDGRPRRVPRRRALQGRRLARRRLRHHLRRSRRHREEAEGRAEARRLHHRAHRPDGALPEGSAAGTAIRAATRRASRSRRSNG